MDAARFRATLQVHADRPGPTIRRQIYGGFAEHLGRGIYEGIWVGEESPIPNTRGLRDDVIAALRGVVPVVRWPGGASPTSTTGGTVSVLVANDHAAPTRAGAASRQTPSAFTS